MRWSGLRGREPKYTVRMKERCCRILLAVHPQTVRQVHQPLIVLLSPGAQHQCMHSTHSTQLKRCNTCTAHKACTACSALGMCGRLGRAACSRLLPRAAAHPHARVGAPGSAAAAARPLTGRNSRAAHCRGWQRQHGR
eukprot:350255-Chlamydomonas_euryale.AAC.35